MVRDHSHGARLFCGLEPSVIPGIYMCYGVGSSSSPMRLRCFEGRQWGRQVVQIAGVYLAGGRPGAQLLCLLVQVCPCWGFSGFFSLAPYTFKRPALLFYGWGSRLLEVKKFVPGHTGSPYQRRMELKLPDCSHRLLMTLPPPRLPRREPRGALHKTAPGGLGTLPAYSENCWMKRLFWGHRSSQPPTS